MNIFYLEVHNSFGYHLIQILIYNSTVQSQKPYVFNLIHRRIGGLINAGAGD
jgi:hypothetical protein